MEWDQPEAAGQRGAVSPGAVAAGAVVLVVAGVLGVLYFTRAQKKPDGAKVALQPAVRDFHAAIDAGQVSKSLECLRNGVHPDDRDDRGRTALMRASAKGQARMVVLLLAFGAHPNEKDDNGRTPLMEAAEGGHGSVIDLLLGKPAALEEVRAFRESLSPRVEVKLPDLGVKDVGKGKLDLGDVKVNRDAGKDFVFPAGPVRIPAVEIDARDTEGHTALMLAARAGHVEVFKRLIEAGADREAVDHDGMAPWMLAAASGHEPAMTALLPA